MTKAALLDNDVVIKVCSYALVQEALEVLAGFGSAATVGVTRLIVQKQVRRSPRITDKLSAEAELAGLLAALTTLEPTEQELKLAADLETHALKLSLPLDSGESQILAVTLSRAAVLMVTGDKRAIGALEAVLVSMDCIGSCEGRIACLEQLMMAILTKRGPAHLQTCICREPATDRALSHVFSCASRAVLDTEAARSGLESYIRHIRATAPQALFPRDELQSSRRNTA